MNEVLGRWNSIEEREAKDEIRSCCGSTRWAAEMTMRRPFRDETQLLATADRLWAERNEVDWLEAFRSHPKIGGARAAQEAGTKAVGWSEEEQKDVALAEEAIKARMAEANRAYEDKFGFIFIVCATGKSAAEILSVLESRLENGREIELRNAAEEQRKIMQLRLRKWLGI